MTDKPESSSLLQEPRILEILNSDSSLDLLLSRLKQSIKACDEFANYLKRKQNSEENYARDVKRAASSCKSSIRSNTSVSKGSFVESLEKVIAFDDRIMGDVRSPYSKALEKMQDELNSVSATFVRLRKQLKEEGHKREKDVQDAVSQAEKAKNRYNSLCSDLERLRQSDQSQKKITLQGRKTGSQQEEDLVRKINAADQEYNAKANASQKAKNELINTHRPKLSKRFQDLILELDTALQLQLQKYAAYNESLIVGLGNQIAPLGSNHTSMASVAASVNPEQNLYNYLMGSQIKKKQSFVPVEYTKHPLFKSTPTAQFRVPATPPATSKAPKVISPPTVSKSTLSPSLGPVSDPFPAAPTAPVYSSLDPTRSAPGGTAAAASPAGLSGPRPISTEPSADPSSNSYSGLLFGLPIESVDHDEEMVPVFVKKCINLIETYGVNSEGIYRSSPNKFKLEELKHAIDQDPSNLSLLDPPDPMNVTDDYVYMIASLLKLFFAELPDPLLTKEQSGNFFKAGQIEDDATMHVQLHRIVFELPDANYFTLRDLLFHFINLSQIPRVRMNVKNLSIVWFNNLLVNEYTTRDELAVQQRVIEELINAAQEIFNPKDD
ncbi:hypothetical protein OGAPHI_007287 [Ogataea philodendri]|uniref:Rho-GAP domain-containing protein n=1 Tax=Ogataea philodendri TaxID=1378263 RepID=A0A9P8NVE0_9ASCO|nr:uncharacterized protein OGAPHI_007287 [Ogataea philodendri]KAH3660082.1 hypothetical protein OGAPHI_007287 [Ogataea philodendri]